MRGLQRKKRKPLENEGSFTFFFFCISDAEPEPRGEGRIQKKEWGIHGAVHVQTYLSISTIRQHIKT